MHLPSSESVVGRVKRHVAHHLPSKSESDTLWVSEHSGHLIGKLARLESCLTRHFTQLG